MRAEGVKSFLRLSALMLLGVSAAAVHSAASEFAIVAVRSNGEHSIDGADIRLVGAGQRVFLDIFVSDWDPDLDGVPQLRAWQVELDPSGYSSGLAGTITPAFEACTDSLECKNAFGGGSLCEPSPDVLPGVNCAPGFIDIFRSDYVFADIPDLFAVDIRELGYRYGSVSLLGPAIDPGEPKYVASLVVDVPIDALGTFTIALRGGLIILDDNQTDESIVHTSARIIITCVSSVECNDGNPCTLDNCVEGACFYENLSGIDCSDRDRCTTGDTCRAGTCFGMRVTCDPGEQCDPDDGRCKICLVDADCDDDNACTFDTCLDGLECLHEPNFNDLVQCCDPPTGVTCEASTGLTGDGDGNGTIDLADFALFMTCFETPPAAAGCAGVDTTCDCRVNDEDLPTFISSMTGLGGP